MFSVQFVYLSVYLSDFKQYWVKNTVQIYIKKLVAGCNMAEERTH